MLPKTGKRLPRRGARRPDRQHFAIEIGKALRAELGNAWYSEDGHGLDLRQRTDDQELARWQPRAKR
jgi:hypothetical protein